MIQFKEHEKFLDWRRENTWIEEGDWLHSIAFSLWRIQKSLDKISNAIKDTNK